MLEFQELRITPDGKHLIVDVIVKEEDYYAGVYIDSIIIDTQDTYTQSGPSTKPLIEYKIGETYDYVYSLPEECCSAVRVEEDKSYCFTKGSTKHIRLYISSQDLKGKSLTNNMFFVYAIAKGTPSPNTPCGMDNTTIMGTVIYLYSYYRKIIYNLKELNNDCQIPKGLINNILRFKALEYSIKTGNYPLAIKYWNKWFLNIKYNITSKSSCYG